MCGVIAHYNDATGAEQDLLPATMLAIVRRSLLPWPRYRHGMDDQTAGSIAREIIEHLRLSNWRFHRGPRRPGTRHRGRRGSCSLRAATPNDCQCGPGKWGIEATRSRTHLTAMHDPRTPEIMAWLRRLPLRDRLAAMHAMSAAFPVIKNDRDWTRCIDAVVAELNPTPREHADIMIEAGRISRTVKRQLKADERDE